MAGLDAGEALRETKYGFWYPRGYVLVAFPRREDADEVRQRLVTGGYGEEDVEVVGAERIEALASRHLNAGSTVTKILGTEHESEARYLQLARDGHVFLLAYAPTDLDAERLMNVVRQFEYALADKFDRLSIHHLRNEPASK